MWKRIGQFLVSIFLPIVLKELDKKLKTDSEGVDINGSDER